MEHIDGQERGEGGKLPRASENPHVACNLLGRSLVYTGVTLAGVGSMAGGAGATLDVHPRAVAFDAFYARTSRALLGQLYVMCGDIEEARDCLQEAYMRAWQRWPEISECERPDAWVRTVAWRLAVSRWHRARNGLRAFVRHGPVADLPEPTGDDVDLMRALRRLSPDQREAIVLHHLLDMSIESIAAETNTPTGTIKARLSRGRAQLAEYLSDKEVTS